MPSSTETRFRVPAMDAILGKIFPLLDDGFVRAIDYMGSDEAIVQAARVSYGKGTKKTSEDRELIRYLMRHNHTSPFEMCEIKLHLRIPMDIWRQWIRHRTANVNEYSTRYSVAIDSAHRTGSGEWRLQDTINRQGSTGNLEPLAGEHFSRQETELQDMARSIYNERLQAGIAREQARKDLPLSTYTEAYWKIDLSNLLHFCALRMESHAQLEIRLYARCIGEEILRQWCPMAWEAFLDYRMHGMILSRFEASILGHLAKGELESAISEAKKLGWLAARQDRLSPNLERHEFEEKLKKMGIPIPWSGIPDSRPTAG